MALGKLFKSLLGGALGDGQPEPTEPVDYKGFGIEAAPINEDGKYRTAGFISGEVNGEAKRVQFIRADQNSDLQAAIDDPVVVAPGERTAVPIGIRIDAPRSETP